MTQQLKALFTQHGSDRKGQWQKQPWKKQAKTYSVAMRFPGVVPRAKASAPV